LKITILTHYFPPEVGAPQNRLFELAVRLTKQGHEITVLTAMPNYPSMKIHKAYKGKWFVEEEIEGMRILRSAIFVSESKSIILRLLNYFSFVFSALFYGTVKLKKHDFLLVESPPLFLGITGYLLSRFKRAKLLFNVSDLWPESAEKLGIITNKTLLRLATVLEEFLYRKSALITGQTQGIVQDIQRRFPSKHVHWLPNGVDLTYFEAGTVSSEKGRFGLNDDEMIFSYAGIIGHAQGLELILHVAEQLKDSHPRIKFCFLGSGPVKSELIELKEKLGLTNVLFLDLIPKSDMPVYIASTDVALIPLKKLESILKHDLYLDAKTCLKYGLVDEIL
jgi:glycosyltransferase involved in cell wall biosynthesis